MLSLLTPFTYWIVTMLWLVILGFYLGKVRKTKVSDGAVAVLLVILAIDAFRTLFENIYFGFYFTSLSGFLPKSIHEVLAHPTMIIIPKMINVVAGLLVLFLLIRRWVPREIREHEEWIHSLQDAKDLAETQKEEAERASAAKSEFMASMSHQLRTPLNAVLGFAQVLKLDPKSPLSPAQNEHVDCILDGGNHLLDLVNEILDLASIESDKIDLSLEHINANDVVSGCVTLLAPIGGPRGINIIDRFSNESALFLRTDRVRLKQILINLLTNAVKFNQDNGTVIIKGQETNDGFLHLSFTDTGIGIAKEDYANVFQPFIRLGDDPMKTREGTGIGLAVTRLLIEQLAGRIGFESTKGGGSTFWIELPLVSNEETVIWTDKLRVGVDAIDKDHQVIISLTNKASRRSLDDNDLSDIIEKLIAYTRFHFSREEAIMDVCGYPDLERHRDRHRNLINQVNDLADRWHENRDPDTLFHLRKFLRQWWIGHIVQVDAEIAPYAKGKEREIQKAMKILEAASGQALPVVAAN